jgi:glycosyltransferase involved in cell wall biosynthesis
MYKLTIGIISYNRPLELFRTIKSLLPLPEEVEVVICDDKSPRLNEIKNCIVDFIKIKQIRFISNDENLGYDRNLFQVIELSQSNHVLLLGDDDYLEPGAIKNMLDFIGSVNSFECAFIRYRNDANYSRNYSSNKYFDTNTLVKDGAFIYNSILFSGLIFSKKSVLDFQNILKNYFYSIYIQVAIFSLLNIKYGSYFIQGPGIIVGGDGESGFGFNEASSKIDFDLKDRSSVISNLSYHKRLFDVIISISNDTSNNIYDVFLKEYKIRSVKAFFIARKSGRRYVLKYFKELHSLNIKGIWVLFPFYLIIFLMPIYVMNWPLILLEKFINRYRTRN